MGKSFRRDKNFENSNREKNKNYKRQKSMFKEEYIHDDGLSDYKVHGLKKDKSQ